MNGFTSSGFLYLINSGIPVSELEEVYAESAKYFALPYDVKSAAPNDKPLVNRGYSGIGMEKVTNVTDPVELAKEKTEFPDIKESLEIGSEPGVEGNYPVKPFVNVWPETLPSLKPVMTKFYKTCEDLHFEVLGAIAEGLGVEKDFFRGEIKNADHVLRLLHYPGVAQEQLGKEKAVRAGSHTDYGSKLMIVQSVIEKLRGHDR
jgi:isopenicillin N synthase-like dioxygenase